MKLKTLKDLDEDPAGGFQCDNTRDYKAEIKAEAIKWVKKYKNSKEKLTLLHESKAVEIFMDFFNITEEDLK